MALQSTQDSNARDLEEGVAVKRAVSKSSRLYNNATWDLVDASDDKNFKLSQLSKDQLPEELKGKSESQIRQYIAEKKADRKIIQDKINTLNTKRETYITKQQKEGTKGELENAMLSAIKKQAAKKNYTWD